MSFRSIDIGTSVFILRKSLNRICSSCFDFLKRNQRSGSQIKKNKKRGEEYSVRPRVLFVQETRNNLDLDLVLLDLKPKE